MREEPPKGIRERIEEEFSFASPQNREDFFRLLDLMGDKIISTGINTGARYQDQICAAVSDKLKQKELEDNGLYKKGHIGGRVDTTIDQWLIQLLLIKIIRFIATPGESRPPNER